MSALGGFEYLHDQSEDLVGANRTELGMSRTRDVTRFKLRSITLVHRQPRCRAASAMDHGDARTARPSLLPTALVALGCLAFLRETIVCLGPKPANKRCLASGKYSKHLQKRARSEAVLRVSGMDVG